MSNEQVGVEQGPIVFEHQDNAPKKDEYKGWIKMTEEQMHAAQKNGTLKGYDPAKGLGLVKPQETKK